MPTCCRWVVWFAGCHGHRWHVLLLAASAGEQWVSFSPHGGAVGQLPLKTHNARFFPVLPASEPVVLSGRAAGSAAQCRRRRSWAGQASLGCCGWRAALAVGGACNGGAHAALAAWSGAAAPAGASTALQRPGAPCGGRASVCRCSHGALSLRSNLPQADMERMIAYTCAACLAPRSCRGPAGGQLERLPPAGVGTPGPP